MTQNPEILFMCEYVKDILYFATVRQGKVLKCTENTHYFCTDGDFVYENYYSDFGPLNIGCVYRYCKLLNEKLEKCSSKQKVVHYTQIDVKKKSNAAFLLGCYGVLYLNLSPRDAVTPFLLHGQVYRPFQDAVPGDSIFTINLLECFMAVKKAHDLGFFDFEDFDYDEYHSLDQLQGGDINWIVPNKFLAFIGPVDCGGSIYHPPKMYLSYFLDNNVKIVIRLNKRLYDSNVFSNVGISHYDLFFSDGSCPPRHILSKFLQISEDANCAIAVHCKAGLGRTGSLIGCYLIKYYRMTAHEAIAWMRICRPGSVIGHQQEWLERLEALLIKQGNFYRKRYYNNMHQLPKHDFGIYSIARKTFNAKSMLYKKIPQPTMRNSYLCDMFTNHINKPQPFRDREVPIKWPEKEHARCCIKMMSSESQTISDNRLRQGSRDMSCKEVAIREDSFVRTDPKNRSSLKTSGAGEPSSPRPSVYTYNNYASQRSRSKSPRQNIAVPAVPTFKTTEGPLIKTINDARNFLLRSTYDVKDKSLSPVTPQSAFRMIRDDFNTSALGCSMTAKQSSSNKAVETITPSTMQQNRRRLGRSPSPLPTRVLDQSRATNTPLARQVITPKRPSKTTIKEELSRLKNASPRRGSIGAASVGAGSLGARRDAPTDKRTSSIRSDEHPTATQGDMLNSIKYQRKFCDALHIGKIKSTNEKPSFSAEKLSKKEPSTKFSRDSNSPVKPYKWRGIVNDSGCLDLDRERSVMRPFRGTFPPASFFSPPRPSSPKKNRPPFY